MNSMQSTRGLDLRSFFGTPGALRWSRMVTSGKRATFIIRKGEGDIILLSKRGYLSVVGVTIGSAHTLPKPSLEDYRPPDIPKPTPATYFAEGLTAEAIARMWTHSEGLAAGVFEHVMNRDVR